MHLPLGAVWVCSRPDPRGEGAHCPPWGGTQETSPQLTVAGGGLARVHSVTVPRRLGLTCQGGTVGFV